MRWSSALSTQTQPAVAVGVAIAAIRDQLGDTPVDLILIFACGHDVDAWEVFLSHLRAEYPEANLLGCSGGGVVGGGQEVEGEMSLSLMAGVLPDAAVVGFHHTGEEGLSVDELAQWWSETLGLEPEHQPSFMVLLDPFSCEPGRLMASLDVAFPGQVKVGGLASGGDGPGDNILVLNDQIVTSGAVGVAMFGDIELLPVVAQGCRPVGQPFVVTDAEKNLVRSLSGEPALQQLEAMFSDLDEADQALFRGLPMVGIGMEKGRERYRQGDFLIRHLMGMDRQSEILAIGALVEEGQVVQFHVRDAESSRKDLEDVLAQHARTHAVDQTEGTVMFSCLGRGRRFFGEPDHDSGMATRYLGGVAIGGLFCSGEIGPVNGQTWLHGYTTVLGIIRPRGWS